MEDIDEKLRAHMSENEKKARYFLAEAISDEQLLDENNVIFINSDQVIAHLTQLFDRNPNLVI